ncbi:hypothetical protein BpHYR1_001584 [Brachionus plicatilis]|uniref:Uncharacterized protein n=1 Tax=Brachionus plicatilis TaxID=10195 RepID=A0A3M7QIP1_BRAPC|nr:hypothetical protein BpHYR1_001584 [Brachionus plicatilis]
MVRSYDRYNNPDFEKKWWFENGCQRYINGNNGQQSDYRQHKRRISQQVDGTNKYAANAEKTKYQTKNEC